MKIDRLTITTLSAAAILITSCSVVDNINKKFSDEVVIPAEVLQRVSTSFADSIMINDIVVYNGTIEPFKKNNISSSSPFRIEKIYVEVGDNVKKGAIIAQMEQSQYLQQELQLENLATDLMRMEELNKVGGVSNQQVDQLRTQHDVAKKALSYLKENTILRSPIDGVVTGRYYDEGDMLSTMASATGESGVATVMQIDKLKVIINISEYLFTRIKKGMSVNITTDSYGSEQFKGEISLIYPYIDASTHTFAVEVIIPNTDLKLRPGMFSYVEIDFGDKQVVAIDDKAVQKQIGSNEKYIFTIVDNTVVRNVVEVGRSLGNLVVIDSGVSVGDEVVTKGIGRLIEGDKVNIVNN